MKYQNVCNQRSYSNKFLNIYITPPSHSSYKHPFLVYFSINFQQISLDEFAIFCIYIGIIGSICWDYIIYECFVYNKNICLTLASWSNLPNNSLRSLTRSWKYFVLTNFVILVLLLPELSTEMTGLWNPRYQRREYWKNELLICSTSRGHLVTPSDE